MSFGGPTKYCPRCNTLLPAQAQVCSTCGLQFAPAPPWATPQARPGNESTFYGGQAAPGGWPPSQPTYQAPSQPWQSAPPGYPPPGQPGYGGFPPQGPPGPLGYAPAAVAPPQRGNSQLLIIVGAVLAIVVIGGILFFALRQGSGNSTAGQPNSPLQPTATPFIDRHGLQSNVPLPGNVTFNTRTSDSSGGVLTDEWFWTIASPTDPSTLQQFYETNLPGSGWRQRDVQNRNGETFLIYCQSQTQVLGVDIGTNIQDSPDNTTITAPSGGSALGIYLTNSQTIINDYC